MSLALYTSLLRMTSLRSNYQISSVQYWGAQSWAKFCKGMARGGTTVFPQCIVIPSMSSRSFVTSAVHASSRESKIKMAVKANPNAMAKVFKGRPLLFVHSVSEEDLTLIPLKFSCIQVVCRQIHVSVTKELSVRRVAFMPIMVTGKHIS